MESALRWAVPLAVVVMVLAQVHLDLKLFPAWIGWSDQGHYLQAARAWAHGNLNPAQHHYPPGYALLAAPFVFLTPAQPFLLPDLICSSAALVVFTRVARRMAPDMPYVEAVAALCFSLSAAGFERAARDWVIPWTTTAAAPLLLACLLFALRYGASLKLGDLAILGFTAGLCAMVRPTDAALVFANCTIYCGAALVRSRPGLGRCARAAVFLAGGLLVGLLPGFAAHLLVFGASAGEYVAGSAAVGFDWQLILLRWVTLAIGPRPLFPQGIGMLSVYPWLLPGIAGMGLSVVSARGAAPAANRLLAATIVLYWLLYLSYRDLHAYGLWRFNNIHYFKWTWAFLAFWTVGLARAALARSTRPAAMAALAATVLLFCWRPVFVLEAHGVETTDGVHAVVPGGVSSISRVFKLPAHGDWQQIYYDHGTLFIDDRSFAGVGYFKLFPAPPGFMLMPLRILPAGSTTLAAPEGVILPKQAAWEAGRVSLEFGLPCLVTPRLGACKPGPGPAHQIVGK